MAFHRPSAFQLSKPLSARPPWLEHLYLLNRSSAHRLLTSCSTLRASCYLLLVAWHRPCHALGVPRWLSVAPKYALSPPNAQKFVVCPPLDGTNSPSSDRCALLGSCSSAYSDFARYHPCWRVYPRGPICIICEHFCNGYISVKRFARDQKVALARVGNNRCAGRRQHIYAIFGAYHWLRIVWFAGRHNRLKFL